MQEDEYFEGSMGWVVFLCQQFFLSPFSLSLIDVSITSGWGICIFV